LNFKEPYQRGAAPDVLALAGGLINALVFDAWGDHLDFTGHRVHGSCL
jgi:hypothetical protein